MKKIIAAFAISLCVCSASHANLKVIGSGDTLRLNPAAVPPAMKHQFEIMSVRCIKCHTMERTILALQTGFAPITMTFFDKKATKAYGVKMLRKPDSNMTKQEVKLTVDFLDYLLEQGVK